MNQALDLRLSNHNNAEQFFGLCLQVFRQAGPPQRVDRLAQMGNNRKVFFPKTQRRIASSGIEPGVSNLSITSPTLYY